MQRKGRLVLTLIGGVCAVAAFVVDCLKYDSDMEEAKKEIKEDVLADLRREEN